MKKQKIKKESIFKSKPFIKKLYQIDYKFNCKYLFLIVMMSCFMIASFFLGSVGFKLIKIDIKHLVDITDVYKTSRAIAIFTSAGYILFTIGGTIHTSFYIKLSDKKSKGLDMFSCLPIFNFVTIVRLSILISPSEFNAWLRGAFSNDKFQNNPNDYLNKKGGLNFLCGILMAPVVGFLGLREPDIDMAKDSNFGFNGYHYFTIQTNLLCGVYIGFYIFLPKNKLHNNDSVLICLITYIFVVSVTYNAGLLPIKIATGGIKEGTNFQGAKTCGEHMVNPIVFISIGIYNMYGTSTKNNVIRDYGTVLKFGMIIPTIYLTYALCLPFACEISVYGIVTNCNPKLANLGIESGFFSHGSPAMLVCILGYLSVFALVITIVGRIKYAFYAKVKKQNEINKSDIVIEQYSNLIMS